MDIDFMLHVLECADIFDEYSRYDNSESDIEDDGNESDMEDDG